MGVRVPAIVKKHKEWVALIGVIFAFFLFIAIGSYLNKMAKKEKELPPQAPLQKVELKNDLQKNEKVLEEPPATAPVTSYFLKPSPEELLQQLASMSHLTDAATQEKLAQLPVLWPVYFFAVRKSEDGKETLLLDVSEDGFGVVIESEVDATLYPQLQTLTRGEKLWIGGRIQAVDGGGTGTIYLKTEQIRYGAEAPFTESSQKAKDN